MKSAATISRNAWPISDQIPFSYHLTESVITNKNGEFFSVIKMDGRSHQTMSKEDVVRWTKELNMTLKSQCSEKIELYSYVVRRKEESYPESSFKNVFACEFNDKYRDLFSGGKLYVNELYLCILYRPFSNAIISGMAKKSKMTTEEIERWQKESTNIVNSVCESFLKSLKYYRCELLKAEERNGYLYSKPIEFFTYIANGEWSPVPLSRDRLCEDVSKSQIHFSKNSEIAACHNYKKTDYFGLVEIVDYDNETVPGHLNWLLEADFELVITNSFAAISSSAAEGQLKRHKKHLEDAQDVGKTQIRQIDDALDQLKNGDWIMGEHHCTVQVRGDSARMVRDRMGDIIEDLGRCGLKCKPLDRALEAGFFAQFPGNRQYRPRPAPITSLNFLSFSSFHNFLVGKAKGNPWGDAVMPFRTVSGSPFYFNFHYTKLDDDNEGDRVPGHTLILGKTGSGKTTLLAAILTMATKFDATMAIFDKDRGMEILVKALEGEYFGLRIGKKTGFNPLQMEPTPQNIDFIKRLIKTCINSDGYGILPQEDEQINRALYATMTSVDKVDRRFSVLIQGIPDVKSDKIDARASLHSRLKKWCDGGEYGWLFDNETDRLSLDNKVFGFDITEFLDHSDIRAPLMMYVIYRTSALIDGRPFAYVFEEFWRMSEDEFFQNMCKNELKTIRKKNGLCIFSTQEPDDALASSIGKTIKSQLATLLLLMNNRANKEDYISLGITEDEFSLIKNFSESDRKFLIRQGGESEIGGNSAVAVFELPRVWKEIKILSGTPDNAAILDDIISTLGKKTADWLPEFYRRAK